MHISDKYLGSLRVSRKYEIKSTFRRVQLKSDYLKTPVNIAQYRGAVGNFNNQNLFNVKDKNKVFGQKY